jgi:preprotein translocase subunit SecA
MLERIKFEIVQLLARVRIRSEEEVEAMEQQQRRQAEAQARTMQFQHAEAGGFAAGEPPADADPAASVAHMPQQREAPKVGRNDPCPCGSGKKFKQCHGKLA